MKEFDSSAGYIVIAFDIKDHGKAGSIGMVGIDQEFEGKKMVLLDDQMITVTPKRRDRGSDRLHAAVVVTLTVKIDGKPGFVGIG